MFQSRVFSHSRSTFRKIVISTLLLAILFVPISAQADSPASSNNYAAGDIQFCPKGKAYGDASCSPTRTVLNDAITDAYNAAQNNVSGTIYLESGNYSGTTNDNSGDWIYIHDFNYGTSLVIQGGQGGGTTTFVRQLRVRNNTDLDFSLIDVDVVAPDASHSEHGIDVYQNTGNYVFQNVNINDQQGIGLWLSTHAGDVTLQNVDTDGNKNTNIGLYTVTGSVAISDSSASNSVTGSGFVLSDIQGKKGASLTNVSVEDNYASNIYVPSITGDLTIKDSTVSGSVNGDGLSIVSVHGKKGVIISNTSSNSNNSYNIHIQHIDGSVSLTDVIANSSSTSTGINIDDISGKKGITLTGVIASGNTTNNIQITDIEGSANLSDIESNNAKNSGLAMSNIHGKKGVSIKTSVFDSNISGNVYLITIDGKVTLNDVTANNSSAWQGIHLESISGAALSNVTASDNYDKNIDIEYVTGDVSFKTVTCDGSLHDMGMYIINISGKKGVIFNGVNASNNLFENIYIDTIQGNVALSTVNANTSKNYRGMALHNIYGSKGATLKSVYANGNNDENIYINNVLGNLGFSNIEAQNSTTEEGIAVNGVTGSKGVVISGANTSGNLKAGIEMVNITGNVKMSSVESNNSTNGGGIALMTIDGKSGVSFSKVTVLDNESSNIYIANVAGSASFKTVTASGSGSSYGINLYNISGSKGVNMSSVITEGNNGANVFLDTISANVSLKNITANGSVLSYGLGMQHISGSKGVKASNILASSNGGNNIHLYDISGDVSLSQVTATGGGGHGGFISSISGNKGVSINTADFSGNTNHNLYIVAVSPGFAVLSNITGNSSTSSNGLYVGNVDGVLMVMNSIFNGNDQNGIVVNSLGGQLSIKDVEASNNVSGDGANLSTNNNQLVCSSAFNDNASGYGLASDTPGFSITTSQVTTTDNFINFYKTASTAYADNTKCAVIPAP